MAAAAARENRQQVSPPAWPERALPPRKCCGGESGRWTGPASAPERVPLGCSTSAPASVKASFVHAASVGCRNPKLDESGIKNTLSSSALPAAGGPDPLRAQGTPQSPEVLLSPPPVTGGKLAAEVIAAKAKGMPTKGIKVVQDNIIKAAAQHEVKSPPGVKGSGSIAFGGGAVLGKNDEKVIEDMDPVQLVAMG